MVRDEDLRSRYRRDYSRERIKAVALPDTAPAEAVHIPAPSPWIEPIVQPKSGRKNRIKVKNKKLLFIALALIVLGAISSRYYMQRTKSPIPSNITKTVNFPLYYPNQKKLPVGYKLDTNSFQTPSQNVVVYSVIYSSQKKLVFSLQQKPSTDELASFNKQYLPIHRQVLTQVGTATEGAIGQQTVVSLPADTDNTWIIITGPSDIYGTANLTQVLRALTK